ncbi:MAG: hypothetical protein VKQ33_10395 [Candidatus Sericytochromatia bacterium]|nr:hypothetical protein [Candidatus Sericytochromatia bacterium]
MPRTPLTRPVALLLAPTPSPDWGHARTRRATLRTLEAEWSASTVSEPDPDGYWAPGCSRRSDGLRGLIAGTNHRLLDRLALQLHDGEAALPLTPEVVTVSPEEVTYAYTAPGGARLEVRYALLEARPGEAGLLSVAVTSTGLAPGTELRVKPVLDIRPVGRTGDTARHRVNPIDDRALTVVNANRWLAFRWSEPCPFEPGREQRDLTYPLGRGERLAREDGVRFKATEGRVFSPGYWRLPTGCTVRLLVQPGVSEGALLEALEASESEADTRLEAQRARWEGYADRLPQASEGLLRRAYLMAEKLWVRTEGDVLPDADLTGKRVPQTRQVLDGLRHNWRTLEAVGHGGRVADILRAVIRWQDPRSGRLPHHLAPSAEARRRFEATGSLPAEHYTASDLAILLFAWVDELGASLADPALRAELFGCFKRMFDGFRGSRITRRQGLPVLLENGLLLSLPHEGWMDSRRVVFSERLTVADLPVRCPVTWQLQDIADFKDSHHTWEQYQYPTFYLPELNAMWLRALKAGLRLAGEAGAADWLRELQEVEEAARTAYRGVFWNDHARYVFNVATLDRRIDGTPSAAGVEAAAWLGEDVFTRRELEHIWQVARHRLLVQRPGPDGDAPLAFGLIARDTPERVYQDHQQLHEAVLHPRITPALAHLLRLLGQEATRAEVLATNLAAPGEEGSLGYAPEAYALPEGVNPSPEASTADAPVPVRAPAAWWSQFCDVYLEG